MGTGSGAGSGDGSTTVGTASGSIVTGSVSSGSGAGGGTKGNTGSDVLSSAGGGGAALRAVALRATFRILLALDLGFAPDLGFGVGLAGLATARRGLGTGFLDAAFGLLDAVFREPVGGFALARAGGLRFDFTARATFARYPRLA